MTYNRLLLILSVTLAFLIGLSLCTGRVTGVSWPGWDLETQLILWEIRLPRTLLALLCGTVLALSGAVLQGLLRNPLADAGVLGVSSTAALSSVCAIYFGFSASGLFTPVAGIIGAMLGLLALVMIVGSEAGIVMIILAGAAINSFSSALTALALNMAPNPFAVQDILFWLMGSFEHRTLQHFYLAAPPALLGMALLFSVSRSLDVLSLGENTARSMGVRLQKVQWVAGLGVALAVGASVAVSGVIGFVGLVVPHMLRPFTEWRPGRLLLPSALAGGSLMLLTDIAVRCLPPGPELRVGVITALLGGPFFLWLLRHLRKAEALV
ncbi:iron ABC transporter permease [Hahella sp. KA22]|uniref:FecCD family ABC transporter permease n=1 Tax=Hahella sp. KA22 TaxID=1628392 RepID=UPI000FDE5BFB|nr:iron ABC transporter permease [Hahella sp. KA22]AZZ95161.1 iron ABC transporter permease [Hahella sp. KA22]QAY52806.1 iron ABC transporter permease [Hahella sp. KA22]